MTEGRNRSKAININNKKAGKTKTKRDHPTIIGVGASAGGLEALRTLVASIKDLSQATVVVVQHLSPQHRSMLADLISRETSIAVKEVQDRTTPEANTIYITPPNKNILAKNGQLILRPPSADAGPKPSVNLFFESLAEEYGDRAAGVILSGTGSDGARGMRAIKAAGGITFAQSVSSAKYDGMPSAAIESGAVDLVADADAIGAEISRITQYIVHDEKSHGDRPHGTGDPYQSCLARVKAEFGADYSLYKPSTVRRRLHRRMLACGVETLEQYDKILAHSTKEVAALFEDVLISVTSFFRDPGAFTDLAKHLQTHLKKCDYHDGLFRVWVPGCATGEEVYGIAMLVNDVLHKKGLKCRLQLFATDLSEKALSVARKAVYPESALGKMPKALKERYFSPHDDGYQVKKVLRDQVVFARQDILKDPPFLKLDLISCRNLLIYFRPDAQDRIFKLFHYSLNPDGILFLGKSESVGKHERYFRTISQKSRIFARTKSVVESPKPGNSQPVLEKRSRPAAAQIKTEPDFLSAIPHFAPNCVLVDDGMNIKKVYGNMAELLRFHDGDLTHNLLKLFPLDLRSDVQTLIHRCRKQHQRVVGYPRTVSLNRRLRTIQLSALPVKLGASSDYLIEVLRNESSAAPKKRKVEPASRLAELEEELAMARETLQTTVEELETSNEELQALNEELQSSNEELQSANEELETSNEELHSTNEELTTLNEELNVKTMEVSGLNEHLEVIQDSIQYPLFVVDKNMNLLRYNSACAEVLPVKDGIMGRNVRLVASFDSLQSMFDIIEQVIKTGEPASRRIESGAKKYDIKVKGLFNVDGEPQGAVVVMVDMTEYAAALKRSEDSEQMLQSLLRNTPAIVSLKDASGRYYYVNERFSQFFGLNLSHVLGKTDDQVFREETAAAFRERDFEVLSKKTSLTFEEEILLEDSNKTLYTAKVPLLDSKDSPRSICTISLDMTDKKRDENIIRTQQEQLVRVNKLTALGEMAAGIAHEINTPLNAILGNTEMLEMMAENNRLEGAEVLKCARKIDATIASISDIITGLRHMARRETNIGFVRQDLCKLIRDTIKVCQLNLRKNGARVELDLPVGILEIECNPVQLSQVLINMLNNSVDAINGLPDRWVKIQAQEGVGYVEVRVTDSGAGIPSHIADKIMTPFFTTKESDKGTGLGLSISQTIVQTHGGKLELDQNYPHTSFVIRLPKVQREVEGEESVGSA